MRFLPFAFVILALLAQAGPARADASKWIVTRTPEAVTCSDGPALASAFADAREGGRMPREVEVAFDRVGGAFTATVHIRGRRAGSRLLSDASTSCAALSDAVVATLLVLADESEAAPPPPPAPAAAEAPPAPAAEQEYSALRLGVALTFMPVVDFQRTSGDPRSATGFGAGLEGRLYSHSRHGFTVGYTSAAAVFGPSVQIYHAAYSYALVEPEPLHGISWASYVDLGAAFGIVKQVDPDPDHTALGVHGAVSLDLLIWNLTLGITARYDGGAPLGGGVPSAWEGAASVAARAGVLFDFGGQGR